MRTPRIPAAIKTLLRQKNVAKSEFAGRYFLLRFFKTAPLRLEQMNIENVHLLCKDLPANPCREIVAGEL